MGKVSDSCIVLTEKLTIIIQLGHPNKVDAVGPRRVFGDLTHRAVIDLAVGKDHMICLDDMGKVFGW